MESLVPPLTPQFEDLDFILIGGFLGAGKTTAMLALARWLHDQGVRIGIITNDQSDGLVDSVLAENSGLGAVRQIAGGCFCCRSDVLVEALSSLSAVDRPQVFLAEPVGSCTDLVATVLLPLNQVYNLGLRIAPMSVLLDARRVWDHYFADGKKVTFSKDVRYIYVKQMEEAEILLVNKIDLLSDEQRSTLEARLRRDFPKKRVLFISARDGTGMQHWFAELLETDFEPDGVMEVDYQRYGKGEALLGWLNASLLLDRNTGLDGNALVKRFASGLANELGAKQIEVAHLKVSFSDSDSNGVSVMQLVRTDGPLEFTRQLATEVRRGRILVNLRAEANPEELDEILRLVVERELAELELAWEKNSSFRPGQPTPIHRIADLRPL